MSSSIRGTAAEFVTSILLQLDKEIKNEKEKRLSSQNSESQKSQARSLASFGSQKGEETEPKKIDPEALAAMSDSESASYGDYNKDDANPITALCTDVIDQKVRGIMRSMTGMDNIVASKPTPNAQKGSQTPERRVSEVESYSNKDSIQILRSSQFSEGVAELATGYLVDIYDQAARTLLEGTQQEIDQIDKSKIEFVRQVTEQSMASEGINLLIFRDSRNGPAIFRRDLL